MESTANLMILCGIFRKFDKFHGKQQNAMTNLETGLHRTHHIKMSLGGGGGGLFINQNISCGYSKELSQSDGSLYRLNLTRRAIFTILWSKNVLI